MNDKQLYEKCLELSRVIKIARNKFIILLPEVEKRKLYKKHKMQSIYEFAAKLGGIQNDTVRKVLYLEKKLRPYKLAYKALINLKVNWYKLYLVSNLLNLENEKGIIEKIPTMTILDIKTLVKDYRAGQNNSMELDNRDQFERLSFKISKKNLIKLKRFQKKIGKGKKLTWEETLILMLENQEINNCMIKSKKRTKSTQKSSRYVNVETKFKTENQTEGKCKHPNCTNPIQVYHHEIPYSESNNHDSLVGLCETHHNLVHHSVYENQEKYEIDLMTRNDYANALYQLYKAKNLA